MNLWDWYLRWRHSKGFGVHSPYAYRFVTDVLRPGPYRYYAYNEIKRYLKGVEFHDHRFLRELGFYIRLVIFLKSKRILFGENMRRHAEITAKSLKIASSRLKGENYDFKEGDFILAGKDDLSESIIQSAIASNVSLFIVNPSRRVRNLLEKPLERGLLLNDKEGMILIPRSEMAYVAYRINLEKGLTNF